MAHLAILEKDARFLSARSGELQHRGRAAHALQLHDVRNVEVAQCSLEFLAFRLSAGVQQRVHEVNKIAVRKWFFEEVNRAQAGGLLALRGEMDRGQDNRPRVRMAGAQVQQKFLAEIVGGIDVENEQIGALVNDNLLRLSQALSQIDVRARSGFAQSCEDCRGQGPFWREHENPSGLVRKSRGGRSRDCFVHSSKSARSSSTRGCPPSRYVPNMPASQKMKSIFGAPARGPASTTTPPRTEETCRLSARARQ